MNWIIGIFYFIENIGVLVRNFSLGMLKVLFVEWGKKVFDFFVYKLLVLRNIIEGFN